MNAVVVANEQSNNPFNSQLPARASQNAVAEAGQQREIAEVQAAMVIAKRFPRNQMESTDKILQACTRTSLAEGALYSYSKGGSDVTGPSIRMAEVLAQCWGNMSFGIRELEQRDGESTVEAFAWAIETNTRQVKVFQVGHVRHTKSSVKKLTDPRDIYELVANQGARRLRSCILGVIPGDVTEAAVKQCEETLHANADVSPEGIKKLVVAFEKFGVTKDQIELRIQRRLETIRPAQVVQLKKVYASLRDGMSEVGDWFDASATAANTATSEIVSGKKKAAQKPADAPIPDITAQEIHDAIANAETKDALDAAIDLVSLLPKGDQKALYDLGKVAEGKFTA